MWAILGSDNETVIGVLLSFNEQKENETYIEMTVENSPAWIGAKYQNGKFIGE